jgi:heme/copper-type cytochrome/quinol oxidase subunit 2
VEAFGRWIQIQPEESAEPSKIQKNRRSDMNTALIIVQIFFLILLIRYYFIIRKHRKKSQEINRVLEKLNSDLKIQLNNRTGKSAKNN